MFSLSITSSIVLAPSCLRIFITLRLSNGVIISESSPYSFYYLYGDVFVDVGSGTAYAATCAAHSFYEISIDVLA